MSAALTVALGIPAGWLGRALRRRIVARRAGGTAVELALTRRDQDQVRAALGLVARDTA